MNYQLLHAVNDLAGHSHLLDDLMIFCAKYLIYVVFAGLAAASIPFLRERQWYTLACASGALLLTFVLSLLAAAAVHEPRPFTSHPGLHVLTPHAPGQSFPSDHGTAAFAIAFVLLAYAGRRWGVIALAAAILIGFGRVYTGIHYPDDVAGAALLAAVAVGAVVLVTRRAQRPAGHAGVAGRLPRPAL